MRYEEKSRSDTFLKKHLSHAFEITKDLQSLTLIGD
jgi:hypothetical protein